MQLKIAAESNNGYLPYGVSICKNVGRSSADISDSPGPGRRPSITMAAEIALVEPRSPSIGFGLEYQMAYQLDSTERQIVQDALRAARDGIGSFNLPATAGLALIGSLHATAAECCISVF